MNFKKKNKTQGQVKYQSNPQTHSGQVIHKQTESIFKCYAVLTKFPYEFSHHDCS